MKTQQDKHNQLIDDLHAEAIDSLNDAIENFEKIIIKCNHAYYESTEIESRLTDAEYDDICQQYVALNKIIGIDIEAKAVEVGNARLKIINLDFFKNL